MLDSAIVPAAADVARAAGLVVDFPSVGIVAVAADVVRGAAGFRRAAVDFRAAVAAHFRVARGVDFVGFALLLPVAQNLIEVGFRGVPEQVVNLDPGFQLVEFRGGCGAGGFRASRGLVVRCATGRVCCVGCGAGKV